MRCKGRLFISISGIMMVLILFDYHTSTRSIVADRYKKTVIEAENMENKYISSVNNEEPIFMIVVCGGSGTNENTQKNYKNQLRQTAVLLKSAAALTKTYLRFLVITDSKSIYEDITASFHSWSPEYQHRLSLEYHPVWYPADRSDVIAMYKPCSTQRLFLPSMFPQIDATIYVDTDAIFMRPPEDLWNEFVNFAPDHVMGISTEAYWYKSSENKVPYYGKNGLNAGLILMNLTRLRHFPGEDWTQASMNILDQFKNDLKLGDQDIINVLFNKRPNLVLELGCEWNYQSTYLKKGQKPCSINVDNEIKGVSLLHGNFRTFIESPKDYKVKAIFNAFEKHNIGDPLERLLGDIEENLQNAASGDDYIDDIDDVLTKEFRKYV